jgi:poly(3-hydroxybutyrate) depolymerase
MRLGAFLVASAALLAPGAASALDDRPREAEAPERVKPGQTALLRAPGGMRYFLRVPRGYDPKAGARLVVFLHGSNMNGLSYVRSFEAKRWAEDAILCCPNGEQGSDPFGANNFTFESAPLVAEVAEQVKKAFKVTLSYVGGHSQGGFLTYSVVLLHPDLFQGAMPMAGDCWSQNEPNLWEDRPEVAKVQRGIAIAVVHGRNDPVVKFEQGEHAYDVFRAAGWQKLRLFAPERAAHMFMVYPVDEVLDWLDAMNGRNEKRAAELCEKWAKAGEWGWVLAAARASKSGGPKSVAAAEAAAAKAAPAMAEAMKGKPGDWIPKWLEFWRVHGGAEAAKPLVDGYLAKREGQREAGARLFGEAFGLLRGGKRPEADRLLERILAEAPCTYQAYYAWKWLSGPR